MKEYQKLRRPLALAGLAIVLLFASVGMTSSQESFVQLDISGATLEGKYLLGAVKGPDATLIHPGLQVYRADIEEGDLRITTGLESGTSFAKYQGNRTLSIEVGPSVYPGKFPVMPLKGDLFASGPISQGPKIDATFRWNSSNMSHATFPIRLGNIVTPSSGPHFLKTEVLILPKDVSMSVSGIYGRSKADPTLQYSPDYPGGSNVTLIGVSGLSPFAEWISINLDGKPLSKAQWVPNPEFGFYQDPPPLDPAPGTWIRRDPIDPTDLPFSSDVGYLNTDTGQFLSSHFRSQSAYIGPPKDIETGIHEVTLTAKPYPLLGSSVGGINILGITGSEGRTLTAEFLLFGPKFNLSQQQVAPGETLTIDGSGFAPNSRVKIFAQVETSGRDIPEGEIRPWIKPPANLPAEPSSREIREVELGSAATDSTGGFTQQVQVPPYDSDFFKDIWSVFKTVPARGSIRVKIDDLDFQSDYSSTYVPEILYGVNESITYTPPGITTPPSPGVTALPPGNITAVPGAVGTAPGPGAGVSPSPTAPPAGAVQPGMENDIDRPGNDYRNFDLSSPDPALCKQECDDDPNCKAFTYVKPGFQGSSARCWLKNVVPNAVPSSCCISGVKEEVTGTQVLDHSMASSVDESTNDVITRTNVFSSTDSKAYSWLSL
ncbi:MAG TPA: PAN domain-containing protein, partial [Methanotrichaceae archaeon]|nr:PAN domain-containing protein [Methanotrichaceae archaeon]